jgi:4-hydroxy-3-polyprenylbenzoate decarboxylase
MSSTARKPRIIVGITGASGSVYARSLLDELTRLDVETHLIVSPTSLIVMREEMGITFPRDRFDLAEFLGRDVPQGRVITHSDADLAAPPASGTFRARGMVVCPCSMKTLGALASGTGASLIARAADACLKERRRLVLVPRETPLNLIHLRNMVTLTEAGAVILPAMPGFYHRPATIDGLLRHLVLKMLDALGVDHDIQMRWKDPDE